MPVDLFNSRRTSLNNYANNTSLKHGIVQLQVVCCSWFQFRKELIGGIKRSEDRFFLIVQNIVHFKSDLNSFFFSNSFIEGKIHIVEWQCINIRTVCNTDILQGSALDIIVQTCLKSGEESLLRSRICYTAVDYLWSLSGHFTISFNFFTCPGIFDP